MYFSKSNTGIGIKDGEALAIPNVDVFQMHRTVSWTDLMKTWLVREPKMSQLNMTAYLRTRIADHSSAIIEAGNKIIMDLPRNPINIRTNRVLMDIVFKYIVDRAVRKSDRCVTFYINLWEKNHCAYLLIGDDRKEGIEPWRLRSMREIVEYLGGSLLILGHDNKKKNDFVYSDSQDDSGSGIYFAIRLPIMYEN